MQKPESKPSFDLWLRWSDILDQRLETVRDVYDEHGVADKASRVGSLLSRLHAILAGELARHLSVLPYAALQQLSHGPNRSQESQIQALASIFQTALHELPLISKDMQKLLHSNWHGECNGRVASDLFKGPRGAVNAGIGSGLPRDGMLPSVMEQLLDQEDTAGAREPSQNVLSADEQQRWAETSRRWGLRNTAHLRRAVRLE